MIKLDNLFPDFVLYPSRDFFSADWKRYHSPNKIETLAKKLKDYNANVIIINRPVYPGLTYFYRPKKWSAFSDDSNGDTPQKLEDNLYVITPSIPIPEWFASRLPFAQELNRKVLKKSVREGLMKLGLTRQPVAWLYNPLQLYYLGIADEQLSIFEIHDEYGVKGLRGKDKKVNQLEIKMMKKVDIVFTTAKVLKQSKSKHRKDIHWFPNAANVKLFAQVQDTTTTIADAVKLLKHPIVGYLGTIHKHTDIGLVKYVAEQRPEWSIVMIGQEEDPVFAHSVLCREFRKLPNVHMIGYIPQEEVISYCKAFDVGIIPYRVDSRFNYFVNPLKIHEYTAMGKPVVTTRIPEVETYRDIVWIVDTPDEFVIAIEDAIKTNTSKYIKERLKYSRNNSWDVRINGMLEIINEKLQHKKIDHC